MIGELCLLGEILQLAKESDASLEDFVGKVGGSPNLAARVLQISNSALYGMEGRVQRLDRAVLILGVEVVAGIAASVVVAERARKAHPTGLPADALWLHSLETGVCAELLTRFLGLPGHREAYLAGLLHDLGTVNLLEEHGSSYGDLMVQAHRSGQSLDQLEAEALGETHASRIGDEAEEWGLPSTLQLAVRYHDTPDEAPDEAQSMARIIQASHAIARGEIAGWSDDEGNASIALETLGVTEEDADEIRVVLQERMKEALAVFG